MEFKICKYSEITEIGSHEQLMKQEGAYYRLFTFQNLSNDSMPAGTA